MNAANGPSIELPHAPRRRLDHIDGLRGLAAVLVVLAHWGEFISYRAVPPALSRGLEYISLDWFSAGRAGVVAFFCVSGFVIPFSFKGGFPLRTFLVSRFFRLYPAYWIAMAIAILVLPLIGYKTNWWTVAINTTMFTKFLGQPYVLGVAWTLTIELMFYAICFIAFAVGLLHSARFNFVMMLSLCAVAIAMGLYRWVHPGSGLPAGVVTFLATMHFGTLVRLWRFENDAQARRLARIGIGVLSGSVLIANTLGYYHANPALQEVQIGWIAINTGYFAGMALFLGCVARRWFSGTTMVFLGGISYSVYLIHSIVLNFTSTLWPYFGQNWAMAIIVLSIFYLAGTIAISTIVYNLIERPAVKLGHRMTSMWQPKRPVLN
jgi:peptidoglycan/LPS O-acetylase OafA/YrhL